MAAEFTTIDDLREQAERLDLQFSIAQKEASLKLLGSSAFLKEAWGDVVDARDYHHGAGWDGCGYGPRYQGYPATIDDRTQGKNRPVFETEQELAGIRLRARRISAIDAIGCGVLGKLTDYTIGSGYSYTTKAKKRRKVDVEILEAVQDIVDETLEINRFCNDLDRELFERATVDGEYQLPIYACDGQAVLRTIEPEQIVEPLSSRDLEQHHGIDEPVDWKFGVCTPADDVQHVLGYHVLWNQNNRSDYEFLPADMVEHVKLNVRRNVKRGLSDFHAIDGWLERASKLLGKTADGSTIQAAIAYIRQMAPNVTERQATSFADAKRDQIISTPKQGGGTREHSVARIEGVSTVTVPAGQEYKPGPLGSERAPNFMLVVQGVLRFIGTRWSMPEFMVSGDASNANYSSTMVAESPFVKATERRQALHGSSHVRMLWRAVKIAFDAGRFRRFHDLRFEELRRIVDIVAEPPRIQTRDPEKETTRNKILADAGIISPKTWAGREEVDLEQERANGAMPAATSTVPPTDTVPVLGDLSIAAAIRPTPKPVETDLTSTTLNGAQIAAALQILAGVVNGTVAELAAVELLGLLGMDSETARRIVSASKTQAKPLPPEPVAATAVPAGTTS